MVDVFVHSAEAFGVDDNGFHVGKVGVLGGEHLVPDPESLGE